VVVLDEEALDKAADTVSAGTVGEVIVDDLAAGIEADVGADAVRSQTTGWVVTRRRRDLR